MRAYTALRQAKLTHPAPCTQVLTFFSLHSVEKWGQVGFTALFVVVFFVLTWMGLAFCRHHAR